MISQTAQQIIASRLLDICGTTKRKHQCDQKTLAKFATVFSKLSKIMSSIL